MWLFYMSVRVGQYLLPGWKQNTTFPFIIDVYRENLEEF